MKVDFMILGAQKCATSTLYSVLNQHPKLQGCRAKEPHFFSTSEDWKAGLPGYEKLYDHQEGAMYFEASTSYTFYPHRNLNIWEDIYQYNPQIKFIYMVRNPYDRIVSSYIHMYERGFTDLELGDAIRKDPFFLDVTRYATQIAPFIRLFGRDNVLILEFEEFNSKRRAVLENISQFLGIEIEGFLDYEDAHNNLSIGRKIKHIKWDNPSLPMRAIRKFFPGVFHAITDNSNRIFKAKPLLKKEERQLIFNLLELDIRELEIMMGKKLTHWRI